MPTIVPALGAPCWFELSSRDVQGSRTFFQALFGWSMEDIDMGEFGVYTFVKNGNGTVGAMWSMPEAQASADIPSNWGVYFLVKEINASTEKAVSLGCELLAGPMPVADNGKMSVLKDPTGAVFSLWEALSPATDFVMFEPHSVGRVELATWKSDQAASFYGSLLDWTFTPGAEPIYTEYQVAGTRYGGIMQMDHHWGEMPSHWSVYFPVADIQTTLQRVSELGGKVCVPAFDAPGVGWIAVMQDPSGAAAYVIQLHQK